MSERDAQRKTPPPTEAEPAPPTEPAHAGEPGDATEPREPAGATGAPEPAELVELAEPSDDPYAGLDEVTRAKRRLLDYGAARDPRCTAWRRPTCAAAGIALASGFALGRFRWLRRALVRSTGWVLKRALAGKPAER